MATINRMSNTIAEAPRNRLELNQQATSKLYAQAQEGAEKKEWDVTNPYKYDKPAKGQECPPRPSKPLPAEFMSWTKEQKAEYKKKLKAWQKCEEAKAKSLKTEPKPKTKGCGPNPKKSSAEIMSYDDAKLKAYQATLKRFQECVIEECKAKCGPKPAKPPASHLANKQLRDKYMKASKKHSLCVQKCEREGAKELDFNPFDQKELGAPKPQKEDPEFKRGNPYLREKKEIKLCDCPPVPKPISGSEMMNPEKGAKYIEDLKRQKLCVEKCKDEGKQVQPYQLQKTEAAPEPKSKPVETNEWGVENPYE
jgi:hypothetical protein